MSGSIFVMNRNGDVSELIESGYENENIFQELIEKYPGILGGDQMTPDEPRKWIFISREMGVPSVPDGGSQWFLDHLFLDQDAIPTFVEVKRSTDTRIRREVVAQMLDYAANATMYWPAEGIRTAYENNGGNLQDELDLTAEMEESFWEMVHSNLKSGKIRLLFVADSIPTSLRRIIEFLNGQMSETEVLGVEIKQFKDSSDMKTFVPRIVGQTVASSDIKKRPKAAWDRDSFMAQVEKLNGKEAVDVCERILDAFESYGCRIWWGRGKTHASFVAIFDGLEKNHMIAVYPSKKDTMIEIQFQHFKEPNDSMERKREIRQKLMEIDGIYISDDRLEKRPSFSWKLLKSDDEMNKFLIIFEKLIEEIKDYDISRK